MVIKATFKITGTKPHLGKILEKFISIDFSYECKEDHILTSVKVPSLRSLNELKRRLGGKRGRPSTTIEIIKMEKVQDA